MASRKRNRQAGDPFGDVFGDDNTLIVTLAPADGSGPKQELLADQHIIRSCSGVGAHLPSDAAVWDLSTMLVDMEPVTRATVVAWLNCAYHRIEERDFEPQGLDEMGTAAGLCKLLAFADAVGSRKGIISACAEMAQEVQLVVTIPVPAKPTDPTGQASTTTIRLLTDGGAYSIEQPFEGFPAGLFEKVLVYNSALEHYSLGAMLPFRGVVANQQAVQQLLLAAAQQTEALLFEAKRLELHALTQRMLRFIAACACNSTGIFYDMLDEIFTDRVLDAMLPPGATQANKDSWISSVLSMPCGFTDGPCINKLFEAQQSTDVGYPYSVLSNNLEPNKFSVVLCEDLMGASSGDRVPVELDLFRSGTMRIGNMQWPVQLLLGNPTVT